MRFYRERILPYVVHVSMRQDAFAEYRKRLVPVAEGRILEIGIGSGLNLPFYSKKVVQVIGLDPSPGMLSIARRSSPGPPSVTLLEGSAQTIPFGR